MVRKTVLILIAFLALAQESASTVEKSSRLNPLFRQTEPTEGSCVYRCGHDKPDNVPGCQCHSTCHTTRNCCPDLAVVCYGVTPLSCAGRCNPINFVPTACQCNDKCERVQDCCPDYYDLCKGGSGVASLYPLEIFTMTLFIGLLIINRRV